METERVPCEVGIGYLYIKYMNFILERLNDNFYIPSACKIPEVWNLHLKILQVT
jgi:hypothetical protein